jgi:hypothetical protein
MQTLSGMRRSSIINNNIKYTLLFLALILYLEATTIFRYLPPLFGLTYYFLVVNINKAKQRYLIFLAIFYLIMFEIEKGFYLFSTLAFFVIFYIYVINFFDKFVYCHKCILFIYIALSYIGYNFFIYIISYFLNEPLVVIDIKFLLYYIVVEFILGVVFI